ncbi:DNA cytosine methyltransferase [Desulfotalea psychrophila]|uniref:DNA (cytosine-5-)-methyltransferase n=1 Tax=Desulfotalea psychrophila (strain LSv54 / DSM 12343) TaxID=177439 RepID=Q6ALL2_DESPS|nr:DNA cytosine methyltransferase [Desulfotalea psychrophila]CAG36763.1 probable modification methylase [Desulfotalea psychrophila LSv54]
MKFELAELFCGPGGIALGAQLAGVVYNNRNNESFSIAPSWATDYDEATCRTYALNIHNSNELDLDTVVCQDVRELDIEALRPRQALAFGFPCNDFSSVGETKGLNGQFGPLYKYGVKYLQTHQPQWFVAENVSGLSHANGGKAFKLILREMEDAGYNITPHLYKFEEYGVPQARHRIIIVGIRKDLNTEFKVPAPTTPNQYKSSGEALTCPPIPEDAPNQERTRQSQQVVERLNYIRPGDNAWSEDIPEHLRLNVKGARLSNIYKRLNPNKPAYTVTGSGGGGTHMYHWEEPRALTNRERARLQTFPDNYRFCGNKESARKQIGMAVPPQGVAVILNAILKSFAGKDYNNVPSNVLMRFS